MYRHNNFSLITYLVFEVKSIHSFYFDWRKSHSPRTAHVHWEEGIRQGDFRGIGVIYKLVGKEDVIVHTVR